MKFTKEQAFENLKGELTKGGKTSRMSDRTINKMLETLMPLIANEETELSDFMTKVLPAFTETNGNMEHDYSEFVRTYKPNTPPTTPPVNPNPDTKDDPLTEMRKKLEEMEKAIQMEKREKAIGNIRTQLKETMTSKGIKDEKWVNKYLSEIAISEELDIEAKATSALEIYNLSKATATPSTTPLSPNGTSTVAGEKLWEDIKQKVKQNG